MARFRFGIRQLAALTFLGGLTQAGLAAPTADQILAYKPKQPGVEVATPTSAEVASCTVELEKGAPGPSGKQSTAWVLKDGKGIVLRKFHDTTGAGGVNMFSYYRDGEEAYRELDTNANNKIDQYRWVGPNGNKWGEDKDEDGKIDTWLAISPEELSQELLSAIVAKDAKRLDALMLTPADLALLGLPKSETERIQAKMGAAKVQFQKTCQDLAGLPPATIWVHLETKAPQTIPADALGSKTDLVRYRHATVLYQEGDGKEAKHNWIQTGEMIQVGRAWRVIQAPTPGMNPTVDPTGTDGTGTGITVPAGGDEIMKKINDVDQKGPLKPGKDGIVEFNLLRAGLLEQMVALYKPTDDRSKRDQWLRQVAECYVAAAQQGDKTAMDRLSLWRTTLAKDPAGTALGYFTFRELSADYAQRLPLVEPKNIELLNKLQEGWKERLTKFIADFPATEDTPDALIQLGMVNEFFGARTEGEARAAYSQLLKNFPKHPMAKRAQGCLDRLSLEGKELDLSGPILGGGALDIKTLKGKAVVVYYWASWNDLVASDFTKIKAAMKDHGDKVHLVGVNLDTKAADAVDFMKQNAVGGEHLYVMGGLESPLAVRYGITALPVLFLVGPDGKVVSRHVQASTLDDELRKIFKTPVKDEKDK